MQPFVEGDRFVRAFLLDGEPERGGDAADVDVVQILHRRAREKTQQDGASDRINVRQFLRFAAIRDVQPVHLRRRDLGEQPAELLAEHQVRFDLLIRLGVEIGQVHRVAHFAGQQITRDDFGDFNAAFFLCFVRAGAKVRRQRDAGVFPERMAFRQRLGRKHVQRRGRDFARVQRRQQIGVRDDFAARAVHDADLRLHLRKGRRVQHAARLVGDRHVHGDEIRVAIHVVQVHQVHPDRLGAGFRQKRIVRQHLHAKGQRALRHFTPDAPHAQHAERFAAHFRALKLFAIPLAGRHRPVRLRHLPGEAQQHREGQLRGGNGVAARRVHHHHAALGGSLDVDVVHADAGAADDAEPGRGFDHLARYFRLGTHHHGHNIPDERQQFGFGKPLLQDRDLELGPLLQQGNALGRNGIAN